MAMAAIIRIIATTIKSSINEKPFCLRMIHLIFIMCTSAPIGGATAGVLVTRGWRPLRFSTLGTRGSTLDECLIQSEGTANDEKCHKRRHKMSPEARLMTNILRELASGANCGDYVIGPSY